MACIFPSDHQNWSTQENAEFPSRNDRPAAYRRIVGLLLAVMLASAGCNGPKESTETAGEDAAQSEQATQNSCRVRLDGAVRRLTPDSLSAINRLSSSVGAINAWMAECAADDLRELEASEANLAFLETTARRVVSAPRFTVRDAAYVRDSLIAAKLAQSIVERADVIGQTSEVERLVHVFRWIGNNISLESGTEANADSLKGFLDTLLTGRGSTKSRIWVLAVLLRQLQHDVVILSPEKGSTDSAEFLIAACLEDRILLFDPNTWLPVSVEEDDSILIAEPAGAEYLSAHDQWKQPQVRIIAQTATVCPRMLVLQEQLPVESSAMLYEELAGGTSEIRPLVERVVAAAPDAFDAPRIAWWEWPDQQVTAAAAPDEQQRREHAMLMKPFEAPFERKPLQLDTDFKELLNQPGLTQEQRVSVWAQRLEMEYKKMQELQESDNSEKLFGRPSSRLLKTRLTQIEGSSDRTIIQQLQKIRNACIDDAITFNVPITRINQTGVKSIPIPEAIQSVNRQATGSALYWIGICQMDRNQPGTAITSFASYRRQYPNGMWFYPSLMNQALAELAQGRREAAAETLTEANQEGNPEQTRAAIVLKRLQAALAPQEEPAAGPDEESKDDADSSEASESEPAPTAPADDSKS
jgi:hypothetical protein